MLGNPRNPGKPSNHAAPAGHSVSIGAIIRRGCPHHVAGLWKQAQAWMPKRSGHAVNEGREGRRERPETW
jgi:hypothetical protein